MKDSSLFQEEPEPEAENIETIDVKLESKFKNTFKNIRIIIFIGVVLSNILVAFSLLTGYNSSFILFALNTYFLLRYYKLVKGKGNV